MRSDMALKITSFIPLEKKPSAADMKRYCRMINIK
jgi:hypothetical protein